ncbi:MAG: hypothetical protein ACT4PE_05545 [Candidatus Eiseniibacteriota bacterium]
MAVLLYSEIQDLALDRIQANTATDPPFTAAQIARHINDAYADVYEISGGGLVSATHNGIWEVLETNAYSTIVSISKRIAEVVRVYASDGLAATVGTEDASFTVLERVEQERIFYLNHNVSLAYSTPKLYSITRIDEVAETRIPRLRLDVWPINLNYKHPVDYIPQFSPIDSVTDTQPSCSDIESRDIALLAAARMAPLIGRAEFVPGIMLDVSERTRAALERKASALLDARQNR